MGHCGRVFLLVFLGGAAAAVLLGFLYEDVSAIKSNGYWGTKAVKQTEDVPKDNPVIQKFKVHVSNDVLADLKRRLLLSRYTHLLDGSWPSSKQVLKDILDYWTNQYDWRVQENQLNQFAHFKTEIEGIKVHFLHSKPKVTDPKAKVYTLLMIHGWPGSPVEFLRILPLLTQAESGLAFEVICPSIPGYGFSEVPHKEGFDTTDAARILVKLMERIQRKEFFIHGGGWGAKIAKQIALHYPQRVLGAHFSTVDLQPGLLDTLELAVKSFLVSFLFGDKVSQKSTPHPLEERRWKLAGETGYRLHPTAPDIVGVALLNSPSALAAYLLEKFPAQTLARTIGTRSAEPNAQDLLDDFLTNTMLYWVSNSITTSIKYYKENIGKILFARPYRAKVSVPAGFSLFLEEHTPVSRNAINMEYDNVVTFIEQPKGGSFAAMHDPQALAKDIRDFVITVGRMSNIDAHRGPLTDFPFTISDPQAPVVGGAERQAETPPRVRPVQPQRFEPRSAAQEKAQGEQKQREAKTHTVPKQAPKDEVKPSAKPAPPPARSSAPPKPSPTPSPPKGEGAKSGPTARPAPQPTKETTKTEPPQAPKVQEVVKGAVKDASKPTLKPGNELPKQKGESAARKDKKPELKAQPPKMPSVPKGTMKQPERADPKKEVKGQNVLRGTATPVKDGDEERLNQMKGSTKERQQKSTPPVQAA